MLEIVRLSRQHHDLLCDFFRIIDTEKITKDFHPHPFTQEYAKRLCDYRGKDLYFAVLKGENKIIGYGMLRGWDEGYEVPSLGICIHPEYQGSGVGRLLMLHLIQSARLQGAERIILKVRKENIRAKNLYTSFGFRLAELDNEYLRGVLKL
jgi:ribosomal protein S18 acetylase RimI-like enzyme